MPLHKADIDYIRLRLKNKGVGYAPLLSELTDHIICQLEEKKSRGDFKKDVDAIIDTIELPELNNLQNDTIQADNYSPSIMANNITRMLFRNLLRNKMYSLINLSGLALGLACFIAIALYVIHETSFEGMFKSASSIYRITMSSTVGGQTNLIPTSYATLAPELQTRYGDISGYARVINYKYSRLTPTFKANENIFYEEKVIFADSTFFSLFDFPFFEGDASSALMRPTNVVITREMAQKYFGNEDALGKRLQFNANYDLVVSGVLQSIPSETHLQFDFILPMSAVRHSGMFSPDFKVTESWNVDWFWIYLNIPNEKAVSKIQEGINRLADEKIPDVRKENNAQFFLQALGDVHLHSTFDYNTDLAPNGDVNNLYLLVAIGVLILVVSAINFINISIAMAGRRVKEIGISKVLGALRSQLRLQFLAEAVITSLIAWVAALVMLQLLLPFLSVLLGVKLQLSLFADWKIVLMSFALAVLTGALSGLYPAFFISSFEPQTVLKGVWKPGSGAATFRKVLVGVQIAISIFLVIGTLVMVQQLRFIQNKPLGYDKEQIVMLPIRGTTLTKNYHAFKNKLTAESAIAGVSSVSEPVGREVQFMSFVVDDQPEVKFIKILNVTYDFTKTMGLEMVQGRDFSRDHATDSLSGFVINEAAAKAFGWKDPIGKPIDHSFHQNKSGRVIGVVKDFNFEPLQKNIDPIVIWFGRPNWYAAVKIQAGQTERALKIMEGAWKQFETEKPFAFHFLDQSIQHVYDKDQRLSQVFFAFSLLSILTAMMGLFGLVSFVVEQRLREIGIRKVLGSSVKGIVRLILKDYLLLVAMSFVFAAPLTYLIIRQWLNGFAFRIELGPAYFLTGFVLISAVVLVTVISKAVGAAMVNPTRVLRSE